MSAQDAEVFRQVGDAAEAQLAATVKARQAQDLAQKGAQA